MKWKRNEIINENHIFADLTGEIGAPTQYSAEVLTRSALEVIENALWDPRPEARYHLAVPNSKFHAIKMTCRNSFRGTKPLPSHPNMIQVWRRAVEQNESHEFIHSNVYTYLKQISNYYDSCYSYRRKMLIIQPFAQYMKWNNRNFQTAHSGRNEITKDPISSAILSKEFHSEHKSTTMMRRFVNASLWLRFWRFRPNT